MVINFIIYYIANHLAFFFLLLLGLFKKIYLTGDFQARIQDFSRGGGKKSLFGKLLKNFIFLVPYEKNSIGARTRFKKIKIIFKVIFIYFKRNFRLFR